MSLAPEIRSLLDWDKTLNDAYGELPLPERRVAVCEELDRELERRGVERPSPHATLDDRVPVNGDEIAIRVFLPGGPGPHPVLVHIHGGGFVLGTINSLVNDAKCAHICAAAKCAVATVEYRLAPEHRFPTPGEDCYAALLWTVANARRFDIDATRVAVGGESAGANLAAVMALMARDRGGPTLALQLLEVPVTDMSERAIEYPSVGLFGQGYGLDKAAIEFFTEQYLPEPQAGRASYASPLLAENLAGVAPAHVMTAELDALRDSGEAYARALEQAGVRTTLHRMLGHTHGSAVLWQSWAPARAWMDEVVAALRCAFLRSDAPAE